jgi:predicted RNA-binding Zn ribbon-like protein
MKVIVTGQLETSVTLGLMASQRAPGQLELVREFVNTADLDQETDELDSPRALSAWLSDHGLLAASARLGAGDLERALEAREALRMLMLPNNGLPLERGAIETLNGATAAGDFSLSFDDEGRAHLEPSSFGVDAAIGRLVAIAYEAMLDGSWPRLKACRAEDCRWAFYDRSRNRSGTWCEMGVCGNRAKVRAYRKRRTAAARS